MKLYTSTCLNVHLIFCVIRYEAILKMMLLNRVEYMYEGIRDRPFGFLGGRVRGCFFQQLKTRIVFRQSESIYFCNHKTYFIIVIGPIRMFSFSFIKYVSDQHT